MTKVLVLYYSRSGRTKKLAQSIALGVAKTGAEAILRSVPCLHNDTDKTSEQFVSKHELVNCDALALGSPTRFGQMATPLKQFIETTSDTWLNGELIDKPACVFTSTGSMHGGQETTLLSLALPLLHHGMMLVGIPYSRPELHKTRSGGSPYGASHVDSSDSSMLFNDEKTLANSLGERLAIIAAKLKRD